MKKLLVLCLSFIIVGCASLPPPDYKGPDAGYVVVGIGATPETKYSYYALQFREINKSSQDAFYYFQLNSVYSRGEDYKDSEEEGIVSARALPPGEYEIFNFDIFRNTGVSQTNYYSRQDFSIKFSVSPGQVTYLGNFQANKISGKNAFGMSLPAGAFFKVSDRMEKELEIAAVRKPQIVNMPVKNNVADVSEINNPFFRGYEK